jgi:hypothetical protein
MMATWIAPDSQPGWCMRVDEPKVIPTYRERIPDDRA